MSFLAKGGGVTALSGLTIDVDKDWAGMGISNIKELALAMIQGDMIVRGAGGVLIRVPAGVANTVWTSGGALIVPSWQPGGTYLNRYFPATISSSKTLTITIPDQAINKNAPFTSLYVANYLDDVNLELIDAVLASTDAETVKAAADQSVAKNAPFRAALSILVDGFVEETAAAVQTDHTAAARSAAANDLNLCPMSDTVLDKIYIGSNYPFWQAQIQVGTNGNGTWTNGVYYWNGAWTACVGPDDGSTSFLHGTGLKFITHTPQGDWALSVIQGMNLYWMMVRTDNYVARVTKPLGTQIWVAI